jgi:hypothetical protein
MGYRNHCDRHIELKLINKNTGNPSGQNDRQGKDLTGQLQILAGHCPIFLQKITGRYF